MTEMDAPLVGIGFGPAGIALSAALTDDRLHGLAGWDVNFANDAVFFERAPNSAWQPGMVLPGTDIQHHFLRDLGTPRFPDSHFSFVRYLHDVGRFYPFTLRGGYVTRAEWSDYCLWAAARTESRVHYDHEVVAVEPVDDVGPLRALRVVARDLATGSLRSITTPRVVLATGHEPYVPECFQPVLGERVFHSSSFSYRFDPLREGLRSVLVVGAGQNAGEILLHLHGVTDAKLHSVVRNSGFRLYDLGHFANQAYWPGETDYFYDLPALARAQVFDEQYRTNYAAVDPEVSTGLYNAWYDGEVSGRQRLHMVKRHEVLDLSLQGDSVAALIRERYTGEVRTLVTDAVILATGFREQLVPRVLQPLQDHLLRDDEGRLVLGRDFRVGLRGSEGVDVYLHGMSERRHGIASATSFSLLALRAGEIVASVRSRLTDAQLEEEEHADLSAQ